MAWQALARGDVGEQGGARDVQAFGRQHGGANGGTGPLALPKLAISPNGRRH